MEIKLNEQQKKAATQLEGNLLIIASAGTGKTTTIIERYLNLVNNGVEPNRIMMTTFTNKAAKDMIEKIKKRTDNISPYIGTMHSLFLKILRKYSHLIFNEKKFTLLTDNKDRNKILKDILTKENIENNYNAVRYFSGWISKYKNRAIFADQLSEESSIEDLKQSGQITEMLDDELVKINPIWRKNVNKIYKKYQEYLNKNALLDFDEILMKTFTLFQNYKEIKEKYKNHFKAIMVDEAQDLNLIQKRILDLISDNNVCFIGDDCQNIYEWRGSSNEIIFDFSEIEKNIFLEENYRSSDEIIEAVNKSIEEMKHKIDKRLISTKGSKKEIIVEEYFLHSEEILEIVKKIKKLFKKQERPEDIAILYRTNMIGKAFEKELVKAGLNCYLSKSVGFFDREEIKDIISILRLKINRDSYFDFERMIKIIPGFGKGSLQKVSDFCSINNVGLSEVFDSLDELDLSEKVLKATHEFISSLEGKEINEILINIGYFEYLHYKYSKDTNKLEEKQENIDTLISMYHKYNSILEFLDSLQETEKNETNKGKIMLSTIHSAKGLEWKHVFLVGCNEGILPFHKGELSPVKKDSELRLFYVAISRAKEGLHISSHFSNSFQKFIPSHFLDIVREPEVNYIY